MVKRNKRQYRERRAAKYGVTVAQWYQMPKAERERLKAEFKAKKEQEQEERLDMMQLGEWNDY
jgi:hypothetical protein